MSTGYGWEGIMQVYATLLGARYVPERLCSGPCPQRGAIASARPFLPYDVSVVRTPWPCYWCCDRSVQMMYCRWENAVRRLRRYGWRMAFDQREQKYVGNSNCARTKEQVRSVLGHWRRVARPVLEGGSSTTQDTISSGQASQHHGMWMEKSDP